MFYYEIDNHGLISPYPYPGLKEIPEQAVSGCRDRVYWLFHKNPEVFRRSFSLADASLAFPEEEGINLLLKPREENRVLPVWLQEKIGGGKVTAVNTAYPHWKSVLDHRLPVKWTVNIAGLGDVGGMLLTGLRLLGGKLIDKIGIYDTDLNRIKRWDYEANQVFSPFADACYPQVEGIGENQVFDCDLFVFCVSVGVPPVGQEQKDVRLAQFAGNARIVNQYAKMAREKGFQGIFAVVSDPVDLLCKSAFVSSNTDETGKKDFLGLAPEKIRGYGLGVMNARAVYFAKQRAETIHYLEEGRAYGPHGAGLVIADSIENYSDQLSQYLTEKARTANLDVRGMGYKPYIAPALSSGALSLIATMQGSWHYSATFMGGIFMGAKNRLTPSGGEIERLPLPARLIDRLQDTYKMLGSL
ncbi:lactate dehydrogenase [Candidatus Formimonas warabiya]|uniref:Lactate dehydrogenase n=1 Tax=Formimonas warabiya TaxID=1761012 RepID=A0A3G1KMK3_FORW1|nr:lactate dehydrogenase [Candidatus Formimonas warabiya]ATW23698.1 lactate dehydrogenase [Candidatus Formimonas warabiya]